MVDSMQKAQKRAKEVIEMTYFGVLTVTEHQKVTDPATKLTTFKDVAVLQNKPCRLSFEKITTSTQSESAATIAQTAKLFVDPDIAIKAGSKLTVTQDDKTTDYQSSGIPAVYPTHQEIMLDLFKGWA